MAALNVGGWAEVSSVSCPSSGNCTAGGSYEDSSGQAQPFVVDQRGGVWGDAADVPGFAALNLNGSPQPELNSVSCASAGNCVAGGFYFEDYPFDQEAFVVSETNGVWGTAIQVPGLGGYPSGLNWGGAAAVNSVACASPGNCVAGGYYAAYTDKYGVLPTDFQAFIVSETNGTWGKAFHVGNAKFLDVRYAELGDAWISSVSCAGGSCVAVGSENDVHGVRRGLLVTDSSEQVPGVRALSAGGPSEVDGVSCAGSGNCAAVGVYFHGSNLHRNFVFVVVEKKGKWNKAIKVPGLAALNVGGVASVSSVSCISPGNCAAGGSYVDRARRKQAFVASEKNGKWGKAIEAPGTAALNLAGAAEVSSVSCVSKGNCTAVGTYFAPPANPQAFVVAERKGAWRTAVQVPGTAALGATAGGASVSCARAGRCAIGGSYSTVYTHGVPADSHAFVTVP